MNPDQQNSNAAVNQANATNNPPTNQQQPVPKASNNNYQPNQQSSPSVNQPNQQLTQQQIIQQQAQTPKETNSFFSNVKIPTDLDTGSLGFLVAAALGSFVIYIIVRLI